MLLEWFLFLLWLIFFLNSYNYTNVNKWFLEAPRFHWFFYLQHYTFSIAHIYMYKWMRKQMKNKMQISLSQEFACINLVMQKKNKRCYPWS